MKRLIGIVLAGLLLTGCTKDVIIRGDSGVVNVGEVTAEVVKTRVTTTVGEQTYKLGVHPLGDVATMFANGWGDFLDNMLDKQLAVTLETAVVYQGTKNTTSLLIDVTTVQCPKGYMFSTCATQIEATQKGIQLLYKEKFSYLK